MFKVIKGKMEDYEEIYFRSEKSFDSDRTVNVDIDLMVNYLDIGVDSMDMYVKCIWGISPEESWIETELEPPNADEGKLQLLKKYAPGLAHRIDGGSLWKPYVDRRINWFCVGNPECKMCDSAVKINRNTIVLLNERRELKSIWIRLNYR